jgi:hypothetical protein
VGVEKWSADTWAAVGTAMVVILGGLGAYLRSLLGVGEHKAYERGWDRVAELEEEVRLLRIALHKEARRGNDGWTVSEILSLAMPLGLEDRIRATRQAREIIERTLGGGL